MVASGGTLHEMRVTFVVAALFLFGACHDRRPPTPTRQQSEQLNEAENMLNDVAANEEGPERRPGPSNSTD
jgi:hypothetical protein